MNVKKKIRTLSQWHKKFILSALLCILAITVINAKQQKGMGIGIMLGEPTGISLKYSGNYAAGLSWSFSGETGIHLHLDYLRDLSQSKLFYYGLGARFKLRDENDSLVGVRLPLGINFFLSDTQIDFFLEVVPVLNIVPDVDVGFNSALGFRYYFK